MSVSRSVSRAVRRPTLIVLAIAAISLVVPTVATAAPPGNVNVQLLAINDFHGNLEPPSGSGGVINGVAAGGVEYLATHIKNLHASNPDRTLEVAAGDLIGASPLISAAFHDEPTIEAMNALGLDISAVGNHEFDEGIAELLRIQNGGCHPVDGCQDGTGYDGAAFQYLAANVVRKSNGKPIFPAYKMRSLAGAKIGFIGLTLEGTPSIVTPSGVASVNFLDEAETINAATAELKAKGVHTVVVLIHEGGAQGTGTDINGCANFAGAIVPIVAQLDDEVDLVISGHTHQFYNCLLPNSEGRSIPVTSSSSFGRLITDIDMTINRASGQPTSITVDNKVVTRGVAPDPAEQALVDRYRTAVAPIANRIVGKITATISRTAVASGESPLGDVIADAQLAYSQSANAQIALMNPGGIRSDLTYAFSPGGEAPGDVTYGEVFTVQPFNNLVATISLTGAQLKTVLEQQFAGFMGQTTTRILQPSAGFTYSYDTTMPLGSRVSSMALNGTPIDQAATYRVTVNNFLADGGDGFTSLTAGTDRETQTGFDVDALANYIGANSPVSPGPANRITKIS
ncbi:MAG TPA: bifunctional metallophosphatase/5'-nucleotidase [Candidatus Limnocylindrales bacterium]|nr:bifunctional metallophosphatase/5'-nucleotidase [Candidatus Limnocylindrales bacterium]